MAAAKRPCRRRCSQASTGNASATVSNSILRGYAAAWLRDAPVGAGTGNANLTLRYSNHPQIGASAGDGALSTTVGTINQDPLFSPGVADYHLAAASPAIDRGDPAAGGTNLADLDGKQRVLDGTNDCEVRRDMGAYEFQNGKCDAPVVAGSTGSVPYTAGDPAVVVDPAIALSDADGDLLASGVVTLTDPEPDDELVFEAGGSVVGAVSEAKDSVTFSAGSSPAALAEAMASVRFRNTQAEPVAGERSVSFKVSDGKLDSNVLARTVAVATPGGGGGGGEEPGGSGGELPGGGDGPGGGDAPGGSPSNVISLLRAKRNRNGSVTLTVRVPGAGKLRVADRRKRMRTAKRSVSGAGDVRVKVRLRRAALKRLKKGRSRTLRAAITFTPAGGTPGVLRVKLRFRRL